MEIIVAKEILKANDQIAGTNQEKLVNAGVLGINIMGSPGSGKTTLLEILVPLLKNDLNFGVIEGDLATSRDAERLEFLQVPSVQINTGGACHLDAAMVASALTNIKLNDLDILFIENVGNLVCPSAYRLGEHLRLVVLSVAEGDDKVAKYPSIFGNIDAVIVNKTDLLPYTEYDMDRVRSDLKKITKEIPFFLLSARTGDRIDELAEWLKEQNRLYNQK